MADEEELTIVIAKRKIRWEPAVIVPAPTFEEFQAPLSPTIDAQPDFITIDAQPDFIAESKLDGSNKIFVQAKRTYKKRVGNGHKSEKTRDLYDPEKDLILHDLFLQKNGQIGNDDCVAFKEAHLQMSPVGTSSFKDVAIFQITGYVSVLHTRVAEGIIQVDNIIAYELWMRTKYDETLWARYNLPLYVKTRAINASLISQGLPTVNAKKPKGFQWAPLGNQGGVILTPVKVKADNPLLTPVLNDQGEVIGIQATNQEGVIIKPSTSPKFTSFRKKWAGA